MARYVGPKGRPMVVRVDQDALVDLAQKYRARLAAMGVVDCNASELDRWKWNAETWTIRLTAVALFGEAKWEHACRLAASEGPGHFELERQAQERFDRTGGFGIGEL